MKRAVITSVGIVSALGDDPMQILARIDRGECGARDYPRFVAEGFRITRAAWIDREPIYESLGKTPAEFSWPVALGLYASAKALQFAALSTPWGDAPIAIGCSIGATSAIERNGTGWSALDPGDRETATHYPAGAIVAQIARHLGATGRIEALATTCAAGNYALAFALDQIRAGAASRVLVGGVEEMATIPFGAFQQLRALGTECRPFDKNRDGILFGEGAALLVVEEEGAARARGAPILAEILGAGFSNDAYHLVAPSEDGRGAELAIRRCLADAAIDGVDVAYVNAHGTGTTLNDVSEVAALRRALGGATPARVGSTKGAIGHAMGAASALEAVLTVAMLERNSLAPTVGLVEADPELELPVIGDAPEVPRGAIALSDGFGFGGNNAVIAFGRWGTGRGRRSLRREVFVDRSSLLVGELLGREAVLGGKPASARATFDAKAVLGAKGLRHLDRETLLVAAALETDFADELADLDDSVGYYLGSAFPAFGSVVALFRLFQQGGVGRLNPALVPHAGASSPISWSAIRYGVRGFSGTSATSDIAGLSAIESACELVADGRIDRCYAGGVNAGVEEEWRGLATRRFYGASFVEAAALLRVQTKPSGLRFVGAFHSFDRENPARACAEVLQRSEAFRPQIVVVARASAGEGVCVASARWGECLAAAPVLALAWALDTAESGQRVVVAGDSIEGYARALVFEAL